MEVLSSDELTLVNKLRTQNLRTKSADKTHLAYLQGRQKVDVLGLAVPPELREFEFALAWPRVVLEGLNARMRVRSLVQPDAELADTEMMKSWSANNLESQSSLCHLDAMTYGRSFVSVGSADPANGETRPVIRVESPRHMQVLIDPRSRRIVAALRTYTDEYGRSAATLMKPDETVWIESDVYGRLTRQVDRDVHNLGRVPVVMFLNRPRAGTFEGESEIDDIRGLTDMASRQFMNMQVASEALAVPARWAAGVSKGDFVDENGAPLDVWEAYYDAIRATSNENAKFGQWDAADMKNFETTMEVISKQMSCVTGLPPEHFGISRVNPEAEGAIRAGEIRMIVRCEDRMRLWGDCWAWVMGIEERLRTGQWPDVNRIRVEWHDAGMPTIAQRADAMQKLAGGEKLISRQGAWDEMGWSEERKDREKQYLIEEANDPLLERLTRELTETPQVPNSDPVGGG